MAYGGTVKSQLPPKVPRPPSLSQNDFTVRANTSAKASPGPDSPVSSGTLPGEWHWPSLTTAGMILRANDFTMVNINLSCISDLQKKMRTLQTSLSSSSS